MHPVSNPPNPWATSEVEYFAEIPEARLHVMHGGGHLFLLDRARESADAIQEFLEKT